MEQYKAGDSQDLHVAMDEIRAELMAMKAGRVHRRPGVPMVVLETALPVKFNATVREAIGQDAPRPARFRGIEALPRRVTRMPADLETLKAFIAQNG